MRKTIPLLLGAMLLGLSGCSEVVSGQGLLSGKLRETSPSMDQTDMTSLDNGNSVFAYNLYQTLNADSAK